MTPQNRRPTPSYCFSLTGGSPGIGDGTIVFNSFQQLQWLLERYSLAVVNTIVQPWLLCRAISPKTYFFRTRYGRLYLHKASFWSLEKYFYVGGAHWTSTDFTPFDKLPGSQRNTLQFAFASKNTALTVHFQVQKIRAPEALCWAKQHTLLERTQIHYKCSTKIQRASSTKQGPC